MSSFKKFKIIALIPARKGSERFKNKNIVSLMSHPLLAYSIYSAKKSQIFDKIIVSTDSIKYAKIAKKYGAEVPGLRPKKISKSKSSDFEWVNYVINFYKKKKVYFTHFFILRPTSPFRTSNSIKLAWKKYINTKNCESLRAVSIVKEHPGKMWKIRNKYIKPFTNQKFLNQPSYNSQYKSLPVFFIQNASLEISNISVLKKYRTITGKKIIPYFSKGFESFDINYPLDLDFVKYLIHKKKIKLPKIKKKKI